MALCAELFLWGIFFYDFRVLQSNVEGSLLNLLIDNSTNRFQMNSIRESMELRNQREKKESTYQKLTIFAQIEPKENMAEIDEEEELCRTYINCKNNNRQSLHEINQKNHERMQRLIDKHANNLNWFYQNKEIKETIVGMKKFTVNVFCLS